MSGVDWEALGRAAVACKGWRWMPGMLTLDIHAMRVVACRPGHNIYASDLGDKWTTGDFNWFHRKASIPDFRDAPTMGCLLALVREALDDNRAYVEHDDNHCAVMRSERTGGGDVSLATYSRYGGAAEAAALVAVLVDAAP